jgi:hypothetical protein
MTRCPRGCDIAIFVLALWRLAATAAEDDTAAPKSRKFAVVAYLPDWRYESTNWDEISQVATHLILHGLQPSKDGHIDGIDRLPHGRMLDEAKAAAAKHGTRLLVCFGGDGRSAGFSAMARDKETRERFVAGVVHTIEDLGLDGVDYKWEYPGYSTERHAYLEEDEVQADYKAFGQLLRDTRGAMAAGSTLTASYNPDGLQEELLRDVAQAHKTVDLLHVAAYDQPPPGKHSSFEFASEALARGVAALPAASLTLGVPFHARDLTTGDWRPYEDFVRNRVLDRDLDEVGGSYFNGLATIARKTALAGNSGLGGLMIWEVGQDCRSAPVTQGARTHAATCPQGRNSSLLFEVLRAMEGANLRRDTAPPKRKKRDDEL